MKIYILRHGEAELMAATDSQRALNAKGREETLRMARWLAPQLKGLEQVLVSPYLRAQQSWEVMAACLPTPGSVQQAPELVPHGQAAQVADYLQVLAREGVQSVLLVSHLPLVGYLVSELCPGLVPPLFVTSGLAELELEGGQGRLIGMIAPHEIL